MKSSPKCCFAGLDKHYATAVVNTPPALAHVVAPAYPEIVFGVQMPWLDRPVASPVVYPSPDYTVVECSHPARMLSFALVAAGSKRKAGDRMYARGTLALQPLLASVPSPSFAPRFGLVSARYLPPAARPAAGKYLPSNTGR
jgi:hypothetical protein